MLAAVCRLSVDAVFTTRINISTAIKNLLDMLVDTGLSLAAKLSQASFQHMDETVQCVHDSCRGAIGMD